MNEITFTVEEAPEGGYVAYAEDEDIVTQAEDWQELEAMVREAVQCHFEDDKRPGMIRLELVKNIRVAV